MSVEISLVTSWGSVLGVECDPATTTLQGTTELLKSDLLTHGIPTEGGHFRFSIEPGKRLAQSVSLKELGIMDGKRILVFLLSSQQGARGVAKADDERGPIRDRKELGRLLVDAALMNENEALEWMTGGSKKEVVENTIPEVPEELVGRLMEMGFSENYCRRALLFSRLDTSRASEFLIEHIGDPNMDEPLQYHEMELLNLLYSR
eukprot:TRINITY_DN781_c1_g1_i1.p1 TRINITY_DN781_c1_g1~~TRINITY_DN781_c1_g1_i1.p1  ORF type:complete len:205 (+),score=51.98 TRINITY_DN781_c1_g1_i1:97-711(+)